MVRRIRWFLGILFGAVLLASNWPTGDELFVRIVSPAEAERIYLGNANTSELANHCCSWGHRSQCDSDSAWACSAPPVYCEAGFRVAGSCNSSQCLSDDRYRAKCRLVEFQAAKVDCIATGSVVTTGCDGGTERCEIEYESTFHTPNKCTTGTTLCSLQPLNKCM